MGSEVGAWGEPVGSSPRAPLVTAASPSCRKANHSGEASLRESPSPHSDALAQFVQQPDMMYFILFLWLLVYCLLLFPQLDVNRL